MPPSGDAGGCAEASPAEPLVGAPGFASESPLVAFPLVAPESSTLAPLVGDGAVASSPPLATPLPGPPLPTPLLCAALLAAPLAAPLVVIDAPPLPDEAGVESLEPQPLHRTSEATVTAVQLAKIEA